MYSPTFAHSLVVAGFLLSSLLILTGCGTTGSSTTDDIAYRSLPDDVEVFSRAEVDEGPSIDGGSQALFNAIEYPEAALQAQVEGRVVVNFVVGDDGLIYEPEVVEGVSINLDEEAIRVIQAVDWNVGRHDGDPVFVEMEFPIDFRLSEHAPTPEPPQDPQQPQPPTPPTP